MKALNPYLSCNGQAREAMTHYQTCFGGDVTFMTVGESPVPCNMPPEMDGLIMHSALVFEGGSLMATDMGPGTSQTPDAATIAVDCTSSEEMSKYFEKLADGGKIDQPIGDAFWGGLFGMVTDKFGMTWMLTHTAAPKG